MYRAQIDELIEEILHPHLGDFSIWKNLGDFSIIVFFFERKIAKTKNIAF